MRNFLLTVLAAVDLYVVMVVLTGEAVRRHYFRLVFRLLNCFVREKISIGQFKYYINELTSAKRHNEIREIELFLDQAEES